MAGAGGLFALLSPILGWLGVAVTGSDTSSNSLFGALQVTAAKQTGLDPVLMAAANTSGGVLGKMISPQNLAIAAAAVGLSGREGDLFRKVFGWSCCSSRACACWSTCSRRRCSGGWCPDPTGPGAGDGRGSAAGARHRLVVRPASLG